MTTKRKTNKPPRTRRGAAALRRALWGALLCAATAPAPARGQDAGGEAGTAYVHIDTNFPEALVFADSLLIGGASAAPLPVPAGSRFLRLTAPNPDAWSIAPITRPLRAAAGDTACVVMRFPYHYRIESEPFGAQVFVERPEEDRYIGATPLLHRSEDPLEGSMLVRRSGHVPQRIRPGNAVWNRHVVRLEPIDELAASAPMHLKTPRAPRAWIDYAALGAALAAGAFAVHYKFRADDLADEYERTRNPALTPRIETNDFRAAVAFGVMQGGVAAFALRLALR